MPEPPSAATTAASTAATTATSATTAATTATSTAATAAASTAATATASTAATTATSATTAATTADPTPPLTDDEFADLAKAAGSLGHHIMRVRQENAEAGTISVLSVLTKHGPCRASELAKALMLDLSTVSRHTQSLERAGYIEKIADPTDRRAMTLHVTPSGSAYIHEMWQRRVATMREGLAHWDPEDLRTLSRLLTRYAEDFVAIIAKTTEQSAPTAASTANAIATSTSATSTSTNTASTNTTATSDPRTAGTKEDGQRP